MSLSRGSVNIDVLREATYKRQNSPIFAPFMINVAINLLNNSDLMKHQQPIDVSNWIDKWGGGLQLLKQSFPEWDNCIFHACKTVPINHIIWKKFCNYNNIPISNLDNIQILQELLSHWFKTGKQNNTYGPYPSPFEQQEFQEIVMVPVGYITQAIADLKFENCFKANNNDIYTFVETQKQQKQNQQSMDEDGKDEYKSNNNNNIINDDPFNYESNKPLNWNFGRNQSQNFRGHGFSTNNNRNNNRNNNFSGFNEEKKESILNNNTIGGIIYYQSSYYTDNQLQNISSYWMYNKENVPKLLFGDNNIDKNRPLHQDRIYFGGQAQELGKQDKWFGYGITTTIKQPMNDQSSYFQQTGQYSPQKWDFQSFKRCIDHEFKPLIHHLASGRDIIIPAPTIQDLRENRNKYFTGSGTRKFRHNLGTGTADLEEKYLKYIQIKLDQLEQYASSVQEINYPKIYENKSKPQIQRKSSPTRIRRQQPVTLTPREQQKHELNLPYEPNNNWFGSHSQNIQRNKNFSPQRLVFDEKQQETSDYKRDPYASIHYESPQHRPRSQQQRRHMFSSGQNASGPGMQNERKDDMNDHGQRQEGQRQGQGQTGFGQSLLNNNVNYSRPHYKSPKRKVSPEEWKQLSTPENNMRSRRIIQYDNGGGGGGNGFGNVNVRYFEDDILKNILGWCLFVVSYFPRKIYIALVIQNRPQDVFKLISIILMVVGVGNFVMNNWDLNGGNLICFIGGIICALCGGDQFYGDRIVNKIPRVSVDWNRNNGNGNVNGGYNYYQPSAPPLANNNGQWNYNDREADSFTYS